MEQDLYSQSKNPQMSQSYHNPYEKIDIMGPSIAHNINLNLANIIEDVKKQRVDIIKLNNELKNSRCVMDKRNFEDMRSRQELTHMFRQLKKEKESLQMQVMNLNQINQMNEAKLSEKDQTIQDLRMRVSDLQRQVGEKQTEVENQKMVITRLNIKLEKGGQSSEQKMSQYPSQNFENEIQTYIQKYREESRANLDLKKQINDLQLKLDSQTKLSHQMQLENQRLNIGYQQSMDKQEEQKMKSQLIYDYHLLSSLKNNMNAMIENLEHEQQI